MAQLFGPEPPEEFVDDGCTFVPDGWWGQACRWHDWHYRRASGVPRWQADFYFLVNLIMCRAPVINIAVRYFLWVRFIGWKFYHAQ